MSGLFGSFFDFNNDGKLDDFEKTAEFFTFMELTKPLENEPEDDYDDINEEYDNDDIDLDI